MSNNGWSLPRLMQGLHQRVAQDLKIARETLGHPVAKGDGSEAVWTSLFKKYLPQRYAAAKATIVDSEGHFSDEIDVVLFDRQYTPLIFQHENEIVVPAEAVYAAFESKQEINAGFIEYAQKKVATVRRLHRTSAPVQTIDGRRTAAPQPILGGFLAFESGWKTTPIDSLLSKALSADQGEGRLDLGCIAAYGTFGCEGADCLSSTPHERATTSFLLELITRLQAIGTAPAIEMSAYAKWLVR
ncbi:MAG: hypothetical protein M3O31_13180 [Acidobacteriota bacterium]|nr:hypothetical protein [Acidobacteriota bacterium]